MGVKQPGREVGPSPPSSAEVENEWGFSPCVPLCCGQGKLYIFIRIGGLRVKIRIQDPQIQSRSVDCRSVAFVLTAGIKE
jgi:hypothetical protein